MIKQIKTAVQYWGVIPSIGFGLVIVGQLMVITGTIWGMTTW